MAPVRSMVEQAQCDLASPQLVGRVAHSNITCVERHAGLAYGRGAGVEADGVRWQLVRELRRDGADAGLGSSLSRRARRDNVSSAGSKNIPASNGHRNRSTMDGENPSFSRCHGVVVSGDDGEDDLVSRSTSPEPYELVISLSTGFRWGSRGD